MAGDMILTLYHGSKSGISGPIRPISRSACDFGPGFYMGTERTQPLTLICSYQTSQLYRVQLSLSGLRVLDIPTDLDWAMMIAYFRGRLKDIRGTELYEKYRHMADGYDVIVGDIANDRMFVVLDRFFSSEITDVALINSLSVLKLGRQYVAKTERACGQVQILDTHPLGAEERVALERESAANRAHGIAQAEEICRRHRRDGRFFDELIQGKASR